jgi:prepilin-type N-terminal cleavage/methylation domain-containing protein
MRRRAFTLVELMTVVAILAILYAVLMPVIIHVKSYAQQYVAGQAMMKLGTSTAMYMVDNDDSFPPAYYHNEDGIRQNWFGIVDGKGEVDPETGLLAPYMKGKVQADSTFNAKPWQGDQSGFGYNWGYLGSDAYLPWPQSTLRNCANTARSAALGHPSDTIAFGTSSYYFATWIKEGDGNYYRYGFIDPPKAWFGNPTLDFRHMGAKHVDKKKHEVTSEGQALVVYADGHLKTVRQKQVKNKHFTRGEAWDQEEDES